LRIRVEMEGEKVSGDDDGDGADMIDSRNGYATSEGTRGKDEVLWVLP